VDRGADFARLLIRATKHSETSFIDMNWFDQCVDPDARPVLEDRTLPVYLGVDASVRHDQTAIAACTYDRQSKTVRLVAHRTFQPSESDPIDFENTIEATVQEFAKRYRVVEVRFDPYQMQASAQRLTARGINMVEFPQTVGGLTETSNNLYELIKGRNLVVYPDDDLRLAISRAVAVESARGWRISKAVQSHCIDLVVAISMAALGAVSLASRKPMPIIDPGVLQRSAHLVTRPRFDDIYAFDQARRRTVW
jgi:phage terminase large subunit-like protein